VATRHSGTESILETVEESVRNMDKSLNPRAIRQRLGLNQQEFWGRIGVTQSGGSRYESGRSMPKPVKELLRVVHVDQIDLRKISKADVAVLSYLKSREPVLYKRLKVASHQAPMLLVRGAVRRTQNARV
jgi:DNA-binding transcriptional regulator YiaG